MSERVARHNRQEARAVASEWDDPDYVAAMDELPYAGNEAAPVLVVCDIPTKAAWRKETPIEGNQYALFVQAARAYGFGAEHFAFVSPCPPLPPTVEGSAARESKFVAKFQQAVLQRIREHNPRAVIFLGGTAGKQLANRQVKITKARGKLHQYDGISPPAIGMLSTGHVLRRPENMDIFNSDMVTLRYLVDHDYDIAATEANVVTDKNYYWCTDLTTLLNNKPKVMVVDTETTGLRWYDKAVVPLTVQLTYEAGHSLVVPVHCGYYPGLSQRKRATLVKQLKQLLEDPDIMLVGHNLKYDAHILRDKLNIHLHRNTVDTMILAFAADDNMQDKSLDECVRRWVPEMAGYNDHHNANIDKTRMIDVDHDTMLDYGGGDTDATFRLARTLLRLVQQDEKQWLAIDAVTLQAIQAFQSHVEPQGIDIDTQFLGEFQVELQAEYVRMEGELLRMVPSVIKRRHLEKGLKFSRPDFVRDILFSPEGLGLKPVKFTKSTEKLEAHERIPSTSVKDHLPYFEDEPFVAMYMKFSKLEKMLGTYVGVPEDPDTGLPTGFWKYIYNGKVHPSYLLHRTNTGRTASSDPNGQNFPKRSELAKAYRKIFKAPAGWKLVEVDLSQAELRIAAWMANERNMIKIYQDDGDIHIATAAAIIGLTMQQYLDYAEKHGDEPVHHYANKISGVAGYLAQISDGNRSQVTVKKFLKDKRQQAKAVNFGFLYGMGWRKFMSYAKTDYGVTFTEKEAQEVRKTFFRMYPRLEAWHKTMRAFVQEHGYVRALHGALRRLPSIYSDDEGVKSGAERNAINSPVQRFASDLGLIALVRLCRDAPKDLVRPVAFIHDALVCMVREDMAEELAANLVWYMETPPLQEWFNIKAPLPIKSTADIGINLGEMVEREDIIAVQPEWAQVHLDQQYYW